MPRTTRQLKIANGAAVSETLDLGESKLMGFHLPAAFDGAKVTIQVSADNVTWQDLCSGASSAAGGAEWEQLCAPARAYPLEGWIQTFSRWIRIRSGSSASPTNQTAERFIAVVLST